MRYCIFATIRANGQKTVRIWTASSQPSARAHGDRMYASGVITDYMTMLCEDLPDVKRTLMSDFGIGFFNVARRQIREIERRLSDPAYLDAVFPVSLPAA